jgi:hypothetical protein
MRGATSRLFSAFITIISYTGASIESFAAICLAIFPSLHNFARTDNQVLPVTKETLAFGFQSLIHDWESQLRFSPDDFGSDLLEATAKCSELRQKFSSGLDSRIEGHALDSIQPFTGDGRAADDLIRPHFILAGRSLGVTASKRVFSIGNAAAEGDHIAVFPGSDRLYAVRKVGGKYKLVGDAYVDGLMYGEAYEGVDPYEADHPIELI